MNTGYRVQDVMRSNVLTATPETPIIECARQMADKEVGSLVLLNSEGKIQGILTEQDLSRKVVAKGIDPKQTAAARVMARSVITISPEKDIYDAIVLMGKNRIKHLPVKKENRIAGIISFKDIIRIEPALIEILSFKSSISQEESMSVFGKFKK